MNLDENCCRVCLSQDDIEEMMKIYEENSDIAINIFQISEVEIIENSAEMPALICQKCHEELFNAISFREKCRSAHVIYNENLLNTEKIEELADDTQEEILANYETFETLEIKKEVEEINCKLCFKSLTSLHSLKDHMRVIHQELQENDMFKCQYCDRLFKIKYYLNRHIKSHHMKQGPKKVQKKKGDNQNQAKRKQNDDLNKCPYCPKQLTSRHSLSDHIKVKHEYINVSERFLCDICGKDFPLKYYLLRHIRASHLKTISYKKKENQSLPCSICGKILKNKGNLSTHEKTHRILTPDEYWYCDLCGNKFKGRGEMTVHIKRQHLFKIRYPCDICPDKSWRTLFQLQRHVKVYHQNIREFKCEYCQKEFGEKNKLICHVRIHTGEQPFLCNFCDRKFTHQTDLRRHVWGHTGERPYKCKNEACGKGFMKKSELTTHGKKCLQSQIKAVIPFQYQVM